MTRKDHKPMLADRILAAAVDPRNDSYARGMNGVAAEVIKKSHRFVMSNEVREAVRILLTSRPSAVLEALQWARPPFENIWIEWPTPEHIRPIAEVRADTSRIGACIQVIPGSNGMAYRFFTAWEHGGSIDERVERMRQSPLMREKLKEFQVLDLGISSMQVGVDLNHPEGMSPHFRGDRWFSQDPARMTMDTMMADRDDRRNNVRYAIKDPAEKAALLKIQNCIHWAIRPDRYSLESFNISMEFGKDGALAAVDDVRDEVGPVLGMLVLMNSKNCVDLEPTQDLTKLNKARRKRNKTEFLPYSIVHIRFSKGQNKAANAQGMTHEERVRHIVRGHFKTRKTGVYWWPAHLRGSAAKGHKDHKAYVMDHPPKGI